MALTDSTEGFLRTAERALELDIGDVELRMVRQNDPITRSAVISRECACAEELEKEPRQSEEDS